MSKQKHNTKTVKAARTLEEAMAMIPSLPESEYQWAAGFIEADGCISVCATKEKRADRRKTMYRYHIVIVVVQKDPRPLAILRGIFGGNIRTVTRRKTMKYGQWTICANRAYAALLLLEPFLRVKKDQAKLAMELQSNINEYRPSLSKGSALPAEVNFYRHQLLEKCQFLNSKEYISSLNTASREFGEHLSDETIPSQAPTDIALGEGVTARPVSSNNNPAQERATRIPHGMR